MFSSNPSTVVKTAHSTVNNGVDIVRHMLIREKEISMQIEELNCGAI